MGELLTLVFKTDPEGVVTRYFSISRCSNFQTCNLYVISVHCEKNQAIVTNDVNTYQVIYYPN